MGSDPANGRNGVIGQFPGRGRIRRRQRQREHGRIVFGCPTGGRDFHDAINGAFGIRRQTLADNGGVFPGQCPFGHVVGTALGTENQKSIQPGPIVHGERVTPGIVRDHILARHGLGLGRNAGLDVFCVIHLAPLGKKIRHVD